MYGAVTRYSTRQNLAALRNKVSQEAGIFEIKNVYLFNTETADATTAKTATRPAATLTRTTAVKIIIAIVVSPPSVFVICRQSYLLNSKS
jgi:hypothetical protein